VPHIPHELGLPEQEAGSEDSPPLTLEAKTESFFDSFVEPHFGQAVPSQRRERTSSSLSVPHLPQ
jgi:hypothetical protein